MDDFTTNPSTLFALIGLIPVIVFFVLAYNVGKIKKKVSRPQIHYATVLFVLGKRDEAITEIAKAICESDSNAALLYDAVIQSKTKDEYDIAYGKFYAYFKTFFEAANITPDFSRVCPDLNQKA